MTGSSTQLTFVTFDLVIQTDKLKYQIIETFAHRLVDDLDGAVCPTSSHRFVG